MEGLPRQAVRPGLPFGSFPNPALGWTLHILGRARLFHFVGLSLLFHFSWSWTRGGRRIDPLSVNLFFGDSPLWIYFGCFFEFFLSVSNPSQTIKHWVVCNRSEPSECVCVPFEFFGGTC